MDEVDGPVGTRNVLYQMFSSNSTNVLYTKLPYMAGFKCTASKIAIFQQIVNRTTDFEIIVAKATSFHWQVNIHKSLTNTASN